MKFVSLIFIALFSGGLFAATEKEKVAANEHFRIGFDSMMKVEGSMGFNNPMNLEEQRAHYEKAKKEFEECLSLDPEHFDALVMLANVYWAYDEMEKTIEFYSRAIAVRPTADSVISALGGAYVYKADFESARKIQKRLEELESEFAASLKDEIKRNEK